ncbi:MAG: MFS transporter [Synergistaceae bacterium]|jgi:predicted MFS family arabinose efflux permease|nr:MFS transporter [Synergistaceae bacterium]
MKTLSLTYRAVILAVFAACLIFFAAFYRDYLMFGRPDRVEIESPALALKDSSKLYIVDLSRKRLLRVDEEGRADLTLSAGSGRFDEIYDLAVNKNGGFFILNTVRDGETRRIRSESVQEYDPDGRFVREVFHAEHEYPSFNRKIPGLAVNEEGQFFFVTLEEDAFILRSSVIGVPSKPREEFIETLYPFPMASKMFNLFDVEKSGGVLFTAKNGEIYRTIPQKARVERIFSSAPRNGGGNGAIPWCVAAGGSRVFFTDLGNRGIYSFGDDHEPEIVFHDPDTIYYRISAKNGAIAATSGNSVLLIENGQNAVLDRFAVSFKILAIRLGLWLSITVLSICLLWALIFLVRVIAANRNDSLLKISCIVIPCTMIVTIVLCLIVTKETTNMMTTEMLTRLTSIAELVARQLPVDSLQGLNDVGDYMNDDYSSVKSLLEEALISKEEFARMYCVLYKILDGSISEVYDSDNNHGIVGYPYDWPVEGSDEEEILTTGKYKTYIYPSWVDGGVIFSLCPVYGKNGNGAEPVGLIEIGMDLAAFRKANRNLIVNIILNIVSMSVVMIIIAFEALSFLDARGRAARLMSSGAGVPAFLMRSAVFLVYFTTNIATGFLPIYAREIIQAGGRDYPFPIEFLIAAPISSDVFMGALASLFGTSICRKLGIKITAILSGLLAVAGLCMEFLSADILWLTAGFALCGFGCGLTLFLANLKAAGEKDTDEKDKAFAGITVALASGVNSGVVFGAFLTNWLPNRAVFGVSIFFGLALLAFSAKYMTKIAQDELGTGNERGSMNGVRFILSPRVFLYLFAMMGPMMASGYFLIYLFPIVGFDLGIPESYIGYSFLLNSLMVVFFSASFTKFLSKKIGKPLSLLLWVLIYAGAFASFSVFQNIPVLLLVLVSMGFADSFGQSLSASYYTDLPEVKKYGYGKALGVSNVVDNAAQTAGPFLFSYALLIGQGKGLLQIALILTAMAFLFFLFSFRNENNAH